MTVLPVREDGGLNNDNILELQQAVNELHGDVAVRTVAEIESSFTYVTATAATIAVPDDTDLFANPIDTIITEPADSYIALINDSFVYFTQAGRYRCGAFSAWEIDAAGSRGMEMVPASFASVDTANVGHQHLVPAAWPNKRGFQATTFEFDVPPGVDWDTGSNWFGFYQWLYQNSGGALNSLNNKSVSVGATGLVFWQLARYR